jgi:hypothetical protein
VNVTTEARCLQHRFGQGFHSISVRTARQLLLAQLEWKSQSCAAHATARNVVSVVFIAPLAQPLTNSDRMPHYCLRVGNGAHTRHKAPSVRLAYELLVARAELAFHRIVARLAEQLELLAIVIVIYIAVRAEVCVGTTV